MKTVIAVAVAMLSLFVIPASTAEVAEVEAKRQLYRDAMALVDEGQFDAAQDQLFLLRDYPLHGYLEAEIILGQLEHISEQTIELFLKQHAGTVVARRVARRWLHHLANQQDWERFLGQFRDSLATTTLRCHQLTAMQESRLARAADTLARELWQTSRSLPSHCDQPIQRWLNLHPEREALLWQRAELAMDAGETSLARYLLNQLPLATPLPELLSRPQRLGEFVAQLPRDERHRQLSAYLLKRLAARDHEAANAVWRRLDEHFTFTPEQHFAIRQSIARPMIAANEPGVEEWLAQHNRFGDDEYLLEWQIRLALRSENWLQVLAGIARLSEETREQSVWQFWLSRAELALQSPAPAATLERLKKLASQRGYYSFLAADYLEQDYQLNTRIQRYPELAGTLASQADAERARELYAVGEHYWARVEWVRAMDGRSPQELGALAELAYNWGWHHQAIMTAIRAGLWDDLELRFPLAFEEHFQENAKLAKIDLHWLYAIARQESAFYESAVSPVGALGMMQMMPATARKVSRDIGVPYRREQLLDAAHSIRLGSSYLAELLTKFNGNRILATAAYNAGPGAVEKVLRRQQRPLPFDVWIETLPYSETRGYVKSVLAFATIYSQKIGSGHPLVAAGEQHIVPAAELAILSGQ